MDDRGEKNAFAQVFWLEVLGRHGRRFDGRGYRRFNFRVRQKAARSNRSPGGFRKLTIRLLDGKLRVVRYLRP